ncbi:MAG: LytTR family DNA-binding domain-containing protein [Solirubrobacteraceae bacterium]|nr:LytTR family DNA-binding domain-containing protein [Solirubrobacteraceae bacterium]
MIAEHALTNESAALVRLLTELAPLDRLVRDLAPPYLRWINASRGQDLVLIPVDEVQYFRADTKYTCVVTATSEALIRRPLKLLYQELDPASFRQIHRSTIVNLHWVVGGRRDSQGRVQLKLRSRSESLLVSAAHEHLFRQM